MSVLKSKRKASQFEVFHHLNRLRRDITDLLLRDFGYSFEKAEARLEKRLGGRCYSELTDFEKDMYNRLKQRWDAFDEWFMDDSYVIHESKEYLEALLQDIIRIADSIGITVNTRKTRICKLSEYWRFLQVQYSLTDTGRVIQKINPKRLTAMRRKMKKLCYILTPTEFEDWYNSWFKGHYKIMSKLQRQHLDELFKELKEVCINVHNHTG